MNQKKTLNLSTIKLNYKSKSIIEAPHQTRKSPSAACKKPESYLPIITFVDGAPAEQ